MTKICNINASFATALFLVFSFVSEASIVYAEGAQEIKIVKEGVVYSLDAIKFKHSIENKKIGDFLSGTDDLRDEITGCKTELKLRLTKPNVFFKSISIPLAQNKKTYLVVPGPVYCSCFVAAHLVHYWIVEIEGKNIKQLLHGQCDGLRVVNTKTNGYRDIVCQISYESPGDPPLIYRYNGDVYK